MLYARFARLQGFLCRPTLLPQEHDAYAIQPRHGKDRHCHGLPKRDWSTLQFAAEILTALNVPFDAEIVSAHRTPDKLFRFAEQAAANGYAVIIAGAGGAAHLPGMLAAKTLVPVLGVPVQSAALSGVDSLYSIVQMPRGIRSAHWPSAKPAPPTPPCWPPRF